MPAYTTTPFASGYQPDAFDRSDEFNADYRRRLNEMALGALGTQANYKLGMAGLQNSRDLAQAGLNMNAMGLQSQERMHGADLGFASKGLQAQSDALRQQLELEKGRDVTQQTNYQQMLEMGRPMRDISLEEMKSKAALEQLQMAQLKAQTEAQTKAQAGAIAPTNLTDFERSDYTNDIAAGLNQAAAAADIQAKRREKSKGAAEAIAGNLGQRLRSFSERDSPFTFMSDPSDAETAQLIQQVGQLEKKFREAGDDADTARTKARTVVMENAQPGFRRTHVYALQQALGLR